MNTLRTVDNSRADMLRTAEKTAAGKPCGTWNGMNVRQDTETETVALLDDSAEEMSMSTGEKAASRLAKMAQKKERQTASGVLRVRDLPEETARFFLEEVRRLPAGADAQHLLALARNRFADVSQQHAALQWLLEELPQDAPARTAVQDALETLMSEAGKEIRAGCNIDGVDRSAAGLDGVEARACYRDTVLQRETYAQTFAALAERFGPAQFPKAVRYLLHALGADMSALTPSCDKAELRQAAEGLYMAQTLGTLYKDAALMLDAVGTAHGRHEPAACAVLTPLLRCAESASLTEGQLRRDMPWLNSRNPARDAMFTRGVRELARNAPCKLYASLEQRMRLLDVLQDCVDSAVEREETREAQDAGRRGA